MGLFDSIMGPKKGNIVSLDIGTRFIKMVELRETSKGPEIANVCVHATPIGAISDGLIIDADAVSSAISQIVQISGLKEKRVICAIPGKSLIVRQVQIPKMSEDEAKIAVVGEVEKFLPFPVDEMVTASIILGEIKEQDVAKMNVLFVATQREILKKRVEAIQKGGLIPVAMDVEPFVIIRSTVESAFIENEDMFTQTLLIINFGASSTEISVVKNGILRFTRIFPIGGDMLTDAVVAGLDVNQLEAEDMKKRLGVAAIDKNLLPPNSRISQLFDLIYPQLDTLVIEIRRSLAYYSSKFRGETVSKIIVTGGGALLKGIEHLLEGQFGIETAHADPMANIPFAGPDSVAEELPMLVPFLSIGLGLCLRELSARGAQKFLREVMLDSSYEFGSAGQAGGVNA